MKSQDNIVVHEIIKKQEQINEEKKFKKRTKSVNSIALTSSLILFLVIMISLIRIVLNIINY